MIFIRADANSKIGMGHIMRCLSIADAAKAIGLEVTFILADDIIQSVVNDRGYTAIILNTDYTEMDCELPIWPLLGINDIVIVDSYYVTYSYLLELKRRILTGKLIYIDGTFSFAYPVDVIVNYNVYSKYLDYHTLFRGANIPEPRLILGPTYAPLRTMFCNIPNRIQKKKVENVLISTGGADPEHIALSIVKSKPNNFKYHLLIGSLNNDKNEISKIASSQQNIILHENVSDIKSLICSCDIVVSAAGSTLYEVCSCGVPLITYILADNQVLGATAFAELSLAINIGDIRTYSDPAKEILNAVNQLSSNYGYRVSMGKNMQRMIDGYGAERLLNRIING